MIFPATFSISFNRIVYLWTHNIRIWPSVPLLMFIHMSTRLLAELISAYQMVPRTIKMRIFCQPSEKLLHKRSTWHHELKLFLATAVNVACPDLWKMFCQAVCATSVTIRLNVDVTLQMLLLFWGQAVNVQLAECHHCSCTVENAIIQLLKEQIRQHSKSFLCFCYKVKLNRMWSGAHVYDSTGNWNDEQ